MSIIQRVPRSFSFCGGGFSGIYHLGVGQCLVDNFPEQMQDNSFEFIGASIGALCSGLLATNTDLQLIKEMFLEVAAKLYEARNSQLKDIPESEFLRTLPSIRRSFLSFQLSKKIHTILDQVLPSDEQLVLDQVNGRTHIVLTKLNAKIMPVPGGGRIASRSSEKVVVNTFHSRSDFIDALITSSFIPGYTGESHTTFRGATNYMDGGYSENFPRIDENTVMVSPFTGKFDIHPVTDRDPYQDEEYNRLHQRCLTISPFKIKGLAITKQNLGTLLYSAFPPDSTQLENLYKSGYRNAETWIKSLDEKKCSWRKWT